MVSDQRARILIVDDDEGLLILMTETLRAEGFEVAAAGSGQEALQYIAGDRPDLMLLDLKLRDIDGPALLERIQDARTPIPFLVVTGQGDEKAAVEVMKKGAHDYVMKDTAMLDVLPTVVKRTIASITRDRELAASQVETLRLEHELIAASERERHSIGADLHDGLGQMLTAAEFMCAALKADTAPKYPDVATRLDLIGTMLREAVAQTRFLARGLVPLGGGPDALQTGLAELASRTNSLGKLKCTFNCPSTVAMLDESATVHLYRIAQEAVNNSLKHSSADQVEIGLLETRVAIQLYISDNGKGLPEGKLTEGGVGIGVMRHRAKMINAELKITSHAIKGVSITCTLPVKP